MVTTTISEGIVATTTRELCIYLCGSDAPVVGDVIDPETGEVAFRILSCEDCMAHQAYSDWYKEENGFRPRWMTREECIEAWWALPIAGERPMRA